MRNTNRKIANLFIGLAGMVALGATVGGTVATAEQTPAGVMHLADEDMHWVVTPPVPPVPVVNDLDDPEPITPPGDDMHW
jgi:hypothetical protein